MKTEIIKPKKEGEEKKSLLTPVIYLALGILLAFKSNEVTKMIFYIIGILVIIYGIKTYVVGYQNKEIANIKNINYSIALISVIIGILVIMLSGVLEASTRYVLGFFLVYMGISRMITEISFGKVFAWSNLSNVVLIALGIYSIFFSNVIFLIVGWVLTINAVLLFIEYFKEEK